MGSYTLDQLCLFNRCMYIEDLIERLEATGKLEQDELLYYKSSFVLLLRAGKFNVLGLYQEYISDKEFTDALDIVVSEFMTETGNE